jgi:PAS domain S-box-containing protein
MNESERVKELLEEIETLRTAFDSSYDGIHILDSNGDTLYFNKACERIEGLTYEDARRMNISDLVKEGIYSESVTLKILETKKACSIVQKVKNGNVVLATGTPIFKNGKIDKIIVNSRDITELNNLRQQLIEKEKLTEKYKEELRILRSESLKDSHIIVNSQKMKKIEALCSTVAKVDSTVLITGESGVGKGMISKHIHNKSIRRDAPFIKVDCSAIPPNLFESEVFGYEKGAFTGAEKSGKIGYLELANGGTIFLDEIGDLPIHMQPKLLRAIQDREVVRVGGKEVIKIDVRFIAATNRDLKRMVEENTFREDLYYRLNVVPIHIPPLRERKEDIIPLIKDIASKINDKYDMNKIISKDTVEIMMKYDWPGNVRELENVVERMIVTGEDCLSILKDKIGENVRISDFESYKKCLEEYDKKLLLSAINEEGSVIKASEKLGIDPTTIRRKLHRYNVPKSYWTRN